MQASPASTSDQPEKGQPDQSSQPCQPQPPPSDQATEADEARQRYLSFWLQMNKLQPKVTLNMAENTSVQGIYKGTDAQHHRFQVDQLETPMGTIEHAVVRGNDIESMEIQF
ncbi:hypothetical protein DM01DRAFT_1380909 [Hesseltinella vesiculosa]|uniref:Gem-associated protein 7 n=1 Tax=Hesseltinella vesiculosa TaxID=101127 RepID=A0A1X2GUC9_9FUNG|nr:hypothetical protein DM01DRAFT_1380909 [Hesseltinella vesiculosa]